MKMGPLLVLMCLGMLAQAQEPYHKNFVTAIAPKEVTAPATDGEAFSSDLEWVHYGIPTGTWTLSGWVFIKTGADGARLMQTHTADGKDFYLSWPTTGGPILFDGVQSNQVAGQPNRENGKWFHLVIGSFAKSASFAFVTLRGVETQIVVTSMSETLVNGASLFQAPVGDPTFSVRAI